MDVWFCGLFLDYLTFIRIEVGWSAIVSSHPKSEFRHRHVVTTRRVIHFISRSAWSSKDKIRKLKIGNKYINHQPIFSYISMIFCIQRIFMFFFYMGVGIIICNTAFSGRYLGAWSGLPFSQVSPTWLIHQPHGPRVVSFLLAISSGLVDILSVRGALCQ